MNQLNNPQLTANSKVLRKNMTKEERHLWYDFLKSLPITVHRQKVMGPYIVDFYIAKAKLVIELDGSQHFDDEGQKNDAERDAFLQSQGLTVLRYANSDVNKDFQAVCQDIWNHLFTESNKKSLLLKEKPFTCVILSESSKAKESDFSI